MAEFTYPAQTLERMRSQYEIVELFLKHSRPHKLHEKKHPGRMSALMAESDRYLQQAGWILGAIAEGEKTFSDGVYRLAFDDSLRLAHMHMVQAVTDQRYMLGEEVAAHRSKGQKKNTEGREPKEIKPIIKRLAKLEATNSDLWAEFDTALDNLSLIPRNDGEKITVEGESQDYSITKEAFIKRIHRERAGHR